MARWIAVVAVLLAGCTLDTPHDSAGPSIQGDQARVVQVIDGDTIDVVINGNEFRVRYIGVNTPERDEICYSEATRANAALVDGQLVTLVADVSDTDQYGRLLRYVYAGDRMVNEQMVRDGWAEVVSYPPDTLHYERFREFEGEAARAGRGCHSTGIFNDGSVTR